MEIKKCTSTHYTRTRNAKIKYLVMHYTGSTHSEPGTAVDTAKYFANATRPASADFICDDKSRILDGNAAIDIPKGGENNQS